ncbi:MAG: glycosyltransferase family 39 protein [Chloroflexi bacterium]|nr:glycosyltransferase family 39 protein [Chloroflexota bacterium]
MTDLSLLDYIKGRLAAHLPRELRPRGWRPLSDEAAAQLWQAALADQESPQTNDEARLPITETPSPPTEATLTAQEATASVEETPPQPASTPPRAAFPLALLLGFGMALLAQRVMEPPGRNWQLGIIAYALALAAWGWAALRGSWRIPDLAPAQWEADAEGPVRVRVIPLALGIILGAWAFAAFGNNRFILFNTLLWLSSVGFTAAAFYAPPRRQKPWRCQPAWCAALLGVAVIALYFRYLHLASVPAEMFSDHAEKLLDIADVLAGKTRIFFPRNTGREAIQMYLTACIIKCLGTGFSFLSLKIGMTTMGLLTLPFVYLLGKELGGKWVGFWAVLFASFAYWPNVIARVALRFALYPAFAAPTLYFFVRGLRHGRRNDFIWAGIFLGIGVHGYSPSRMIPITLLAGVALFLLHQRETDRRKRALIGLALTALLSFMVFLPLFRYMLGHWDMFFYRGATRLGQLERPYPGNPVVIFFSNLFKAWLMPFWDNGEIWVHSVPHRPALDWVTAALYALGLTVAVLRYSRRKTWEDAFLVISIPLLMLPSILSLAFPNENPSLNRTGAAYIPVFVIVGMGADALRQALRDWRPRLGQWLGVGMIAVLALVAARANYDLVFHQYADEFRLGSWNTSEIGAVIHEFVAEGGNPHAVWVVPYPYWVDTRLVAINAGLFPEITDLALPREQLESTLNVPPPKLFIVKPEDAETLDKLQHLYPNGVVRLYHSPTPGKDFLMFYVP